MTFTPTAGFTGKVQASYIIKDSAGRISNAAALTVTVKPNPAAAILLASFENGTSGRHWHSFAVLGLLHQRDVQP